MLLQKMYSRFWPDIDWITALCSTMQELKEQKRFDLVGMVLSETLKAGGTKIGPREFTTGISACARAKDWQLAMHLLGSMGMGNAQVEATVISYNCTISACEKIGQWQLAMQLLDDSMRKGKVEANVISYNSTISACEKGGQWQLAMQLFDSMRKAKVQVDVISYIHHKCV